MSAGKPRNGYKLGLVVERDETVLCEVHGRSVREGEVHITITGQCCDEMVPHVRELFPEHRVSRADASVDFAADFDALDGLALAFAHERGISYELRTNSQNGATRYLGSRKSEVFVRVYKKTEQLRELHPDQADSVPDGIVRAEVEVRPGKRAMKARLATMTPDDLWGMSKWSRELAAQLVGVHAARTVTHFDRATDWQRALHYLGRQYGPGSRKRAALVGFTQARREVLQALGLDDGQEATG